MADKYCDPGLYGNATFVASTSGSSTTLTIASISAGIVTAGMQLSGSGFSAGDYIASLGTSTGGAGTVIMGTARTIAASTTVTGTMGNIAPVANGGAAAWATAQEGDGTATGAATSATVSIDMTSMTAAATNTFVIMGATLTCVASGATTNQFNAGSGATLVSNLVTAINRTTNTATIAAQATGWATPKVQDAVYAKIGSPTTTLVIMTRAGSSQYNSSTVTQSGITGGGGPYTFSGGAGGAWGHLGNLLGVTNASAVATGGYGLWAAAQPLAGVQNPGDRVYIRARGQEMSAISATLTMPSTIGSTALPVVHYIDSGNKWGGDSSTATLTLNERATSGNSLTLTFSGATWHSLVGKKIGTDSWNLILSNQATAVNAYVALSPCHVDGVSMNAVSTSGGAYISFPPTSTMLCRCANMKIVNAPAAAALQMGSNNTYAVELENIVIDNTGNASVGKVAQLTANGTRIRSRGLRFTNFVVGSSLHGGTPGTHHWDMLDTAWGNVTARGPYCGGASSDDLSSNYIVSASTIAPYDQHQDTARGFVAWNSGTSQPTLNATLADGTTKWSYLMLPNTTAGYTTGKMPLATPEIVKLNTLASAARTFTIEFCASDQESWTAADVHAVIRYQDGSGVWVFLSTFDPTAGSLTTSSSTWSAESTGKVTYSSGGTLYHNKYKLQISTPASQDLPINALVYATFYVNKVVGNSTRFVFVDPDIGIA